jgi:ribosomal protein L24E
MKWFPLPPHAQLNTENPVCALSGKTVQPGDDLTYVKGKGLCLVEEVNKKRPR